MKLKGSIVNSIIIVALLVLIAGQGLLWTWFLLTYKGLAVKSLNDKVASLGGTLSGIAAKCVLDGTYEIFDSFAEVAEKDEDIISIKVFDKAGTLLIERKSKKAEDQNSWNPFYVPLRNTLKLPITLGGEKLGSIELIYSGKRSNADIRWLLMVSPIAQVIVFLVMTYAMFFFIQKKVGKPIGKLQDSIKQVTDGNLTVKIPDVGRNELTSIANGLGYLVTGLSNTVKKLRSTASNVEMAIKQLHLTFENVVTKGFQQQSSSLDNISASLKKANESQKNIIDNTEKLSGFTTENVTSLLEMKTIAEEMASSSGKLFNASENSYSTVAEMSQTAKVMADNAEKVLTSVEDTLASVEQLSASVKEVENSAKESAVLAENVRTIAAEKGIFAVTEAVEGIERIAERVKFSVDIVRRLGARSHDIEKMLSVIKEVTEQTNLLSLNAAILATQAGEYGKGFSVVADEIRALSDRTASSTKEITSIVRTLQAEISDVVGAIESGMLLVEEGSALVYKAGESIGTILEAAQKSSRMATSIAGATEEQAKGLKQIGLAGDDIRKLTSSMTKGTTEQAQSSGYILERIGEVNEIAELIKMGTGEQAEGTKIISKNLELASDRVHEIVQSVINQEKMNEDVITHIEQIRKIGNATIRDIDSVSMSLTTLEEEINTLKKEMGAFKVQ